MYVLENMFVPAKNKNPASPYLTRFRGISFSMSHWGIEPQTT